MEHAFTTAAAAEVEADWGKKIERKKMMERKMESAAVGGSFDDMLGRLRVVFESDRINIDEVKSILEAYRSNPKDWRRFAKFDTLRYTRNLVDTGNGRYSMMLLCWGEGHFSNIHDHSNAHCFVKVLDGELKETLFGWPPTAHHSPPTESGTVGAGCEGGCGSEVGCGLSESPALTAMQDLEIGVNYYPKDGVTYINDSIGLHRVENASHITPAVSLHIYCPGFDTCRTFDQRTGQVRIAKMTFWSKYGVRTPFGENVNECSETLGSVDVTAHM